MSSGPGSAASRARARNIVVFVADQLRKDHLGFGGQPDVATPALDRLAGQGSVFRRAFVANPVCMPNRATIATGRWPSVHGTRTNGISLDWDAMTFVKALRSAGWATAAVGKLHFQTMGWDFEDYQLDEMRRSVPWLLDPALVDAVDRRRAAGWDAWEDYSRHRREDVVLPPDYYGFDRVDLTTGHGDTVSGNYVAWARAQGYDPLTDGGATNSPQVYEGWEQVYQSALPLAVHPTSYVTQRSVDALERFSRRNQPFLLYVSYPDPHHPFAPPKEYWGRRDPATLALPRTFDDEHTGSPDHVKRLMADRGRPGADPTMTWAPTAEQYRQALAAELGSVEMLDDSVATVLAALDRLGLSDDTAVLFTADHGDAFGDHGLMLKHFVHYQGILTVPLVLSVPGAEPGEIDTLVSSADIAPTVLDIAGVPHYRGIQGRTLLPAVDGDRTTPRRALVVEEDQPFGTAGLPGPVRMRTLISDTARLTEYPDHGVTELYDLTEDPDERHNIAADPEAAGLLNHARTTMLHEVIRLADAGTAPTHAA